MILASEIAFALEIPDDALTGALIGLLVGLTSALLLCVVTSVLESVLSFGMSGSSRSIGAYAKPVALYSVIGACFGFVLGYNGAHWLLIVVLYIVLLIILMKWWSARSK